jgi:bleomycin hydrolase
LESGFDNYTVTDDHLMHITGMGKGKNGAKYYLVKNSWGTEKGEKGYWFLSEDFVKLNTIAILVHKNAIPAGIKAKLGLAQ